MPNQRQVEVFSAGCPVCEVLIERVHDIACRSCEVTVLDMNDVRIRLQLLKRWTLANRTLTHSAAFFFNTEYFGIAQYRNLRPVCSFD